MLKFEKCSLEPNGLERSSDDESNSLDRTDSQRLDSRLSHFVVSRRSIIDNFVHNGHDKSDAVGRDTARDVDCLEVGGYGKFHYNRGIPGASPP